MDRQAIIETALNQLDGSGSDAEWAAVELLRRHAGDRLPGLLLTQYRAASKAGRRASCVYHATRYARTNAEAVQLGKEALFDRAHGPRYRACLLLAYSLDRTALPGLRKALEMGSASSRDDFRAAIDAVENGNHHYFVDREHSGMVTLNIR
jgi:hypothetical protein